MKLDMGFFELVKIKVENGNLHHIGIIVIAGKGVFFHKFPLSSLEKAAVGNASRKVRWFCMCLKNMIVSQDQKACRSAGRIADTLSRLRVNEGNY